MKIWEVFVGECGFGREHLGQEVADKGDGHDGECSGQLFKTWVKG
jgi:hypothetical protein